MDPAALKPLIAKHLGVDDDGTLSGFIHSLLSQSSSLESFKKLAAANGGEDFPQEFISGCYSLYAPASSLSLPNTRPPAALKALTKPSQNGDRNRERDRKPELRAGSIVQGVVSNIVPYGAFVKLDGKKSGLAHISQLSVRRISSPELVVKTGQQVFVKILAMSPKISLSMKNIDQVTGIEELEEDRGRDTTHTPEPKRRRLTSPERWEIRQLIAAGVASAKDYPELDDPDVADEAVDEPEIDVHIKEDIPKFLENQNIETVVVPSVQKSQPEGTLAQVAATGSKFAQEYREQNKDKAADVISQWRKQQTEINYAKPALLSMAEARKQLPVYAMRQQIVDTIRDNQFVVVVGETGSGKTTQIVQYLYEEGMAGANRMIGITQPRRVAASTVAARVAEEMGVKLGEEVGYYVRFEDVTSSRTRIKYMTDGMLQREALSDATMSKYSVIMLDEAHERTVATDILFALVKQAAKANPNLRVICTSATLDSAKFSHYFGDCPVLNIPGRTFPVETMYTAQPEVDYVASVLDSVMQIHLSEPLGGDILVFLTGQDEIDACCSALFERVKVLGDSVSPLIVLPMYAALPPEMQRKVFEAAPKGTRKVVVATNIAETSITIDGIRYVVDSGFVKLNAYDARLGMDTLKVVPISQAQANQRSGRAGRTAPGKCYRLYTEKAYEREMKATTTPEIQRQNLSHTILMLKAMGINDLLGFDFMDPPPKSAMLVALRDLYTLGALNDEGFLTPLGRSMAEFPMDPMLAKTLILSSQEPFSCSQEVMSIIAMLSVQSIWYRPKEHEADADRRKQRFHHSQSDHLTLLNVYRGWELSNRSGKWCRDNYIQERSMKRALEVRKQLATIMNRSDQSIVSCGSNLDRVRQVIAAGFFKHSARRDRVEGYKTLSTDTPVAIHPSSCLYTKRPEYVVYHSLLLTTREYMQVVTEVNPKWLVQAAPHYFGETDAKTLAMKKRSEKLVELGRGGDWRLQNQYQARAKKMARDP
ncbi:hypothetical protein DIURU_000812 [Diutina rugosa]|uniref:RNA helicase n=1 Tax=Diutina rugosa TaxID=5481 RepID=A0A642UWV8_DIURU|nr:uncharacterized protein DIURU_000812 [Diutina rugosa]KAA8907128.1 hypothetical protein DIURU_000812 [Diutina rugosa]